MPVIRPEMINPNITRKDLLPLSFLKKSAYTGSKRRMNYKLAKTEVPVEPVSAEPVPEGETAPEPEMKKVLRVWCWQGPFAFDVTEPEKMETVDMEFSDSGIDAAIEWLNEQLVRFDNTEET